MPAFGRHHSAQIVNLNDRLFLVDCGEGTQMRLTDFKIKRGKINHIFISHLHGDHFFGLIGLLTSFELNSRVNDLHIYGPSGLQEIIDVQLKHSNSSFSFPLHFHPTQAQSKELLFESKELYVYSFPLLHGIACTGFLFLEKERPKNIRKDKIQSLQLDIAAIKAIKEGADYTTPEGVLIPNDELTFNAHTPRSYAYCSDTAYHEAIVEHIKGVDLLYHETTFAAEELVRAEKSLHSTTHQTASIAQQAGVKQLLIGHLSIKYPDPAPLLEEVLSKFPNTLYATEGETFPIG